MNSPSVPAESSGPLQDSQPIVNVDTRSRHNPKILWIGCSDARVPDSVMRSSDQIFVQRNIANQFHLTDTNAVAVLTYGVTGIKDNPITQIRVVGHTDCGGVSACHKAANSNSDVPPSNSVLWKWLGKLRMTADRYKREDVNELVRENVRMQVRNVGIMPEQLGRQDVAVQGYVYDVDKPAEKPQPVDAEYRRVKFEHKIVEFNNLKIFVPILSCQSSSDHDWYYLGPVTVTSNMDDQMGLLVRASNPSALSEVLDWVQVSADSEAGFSTWSGVVLDNYVVVCHFFVTGLSKPTSQQTAKIKAIGKDLVEELLADRVIWAHNPKLNLRLLNALIMIDKFRHVSTGAFVDASDSAQWMEKMIFRVLEEGYIYRRNTTTYFSVLNIS